MDKIKLISFLVFIGMPVRGTDIERTINESKFDLTGVILNMASQRIQWPLDTIIDRYARYDTTMENLSLPLSDKP